MRERRLPVLGAGRKCMDWIFTCRSFSECLSASVQAIQIGSPGNEFYSFVTAFVRIIVFHAPIYYLFARKLRAAPEDRDYSNVAITSILTAVAALQFMFLKLTIVYDLGVLPIPGWGDENWIEIPVSAFFMLGSLIVAVYVWYKFVSSRVFLWGDQYYGYRRGKTETAIILSLPVFGIFLTFCWVLMSIGLSKLWGTPDNNAVSWRRDYLIAFFLMVALGSLVAIFG